MPPTCIGAFGVSKYRKDASRPLNCCMALPPSLPSAPDPACPTRDDGHLVLEPVHDDLPLLSLNRHAEYAFKHPLTQELAYRSQLTERRGRVHAAVERAIEELESENLGEVPVPEAL